VQRVEQGAWNETMIFLPYEESYYGAVAMIMALEGKPVNGYVDERNAAGDQAGVDPRDEAKTPPSSGRITRRRRRGPN